MWLNCGLVVVVTTPKITVVDRFLKPWQYNCLGLFISYDYLPGQLGLGDSVDRNIPGQVSIAGCRPRNVACGWWHTLLLGDKTV